MSELTDFFNQLESKDNKLKTFVSENEAYASFINDFEMLMDLNGLTQKDIAKKIGTTQSAVSRILALSKNPYYKILNKMSEAVGEKLYITPQADMTVTVPFDLQEKVQSIAEYENKTTKDFLEDLIRKEIDSKYIDVQQKILISQIGKDINVQLNDVVFNPMEEICQDNLSFKDIFIAA